MVAFGLNHQFDCHLRNVESNMENILVSIICNTYNHEKYIADALNGFLMQKTNFKYEVLIHDDASTDRTADIIRQYEEKYPEIIKPIYQTENQWSKHDGSIRRMQMSRTKGKYIALCEGDDFWVNKNKLQTQIDYLEEHPECSMCVHAAYRVNKDKRRLCKNIRPYVDNKKFTVDEIIAGGGGLFATASIVYPRGLGEKRPYFFSIAPVGDYPLAIYLALQGKVFYFDEFMSAYRSMSQGSWSERLQSGGPEKLEDLSIAMEKMLDEVNAYSDYEYDDAIRKRQFVNRFHLLVAKRDYEELEKNEYKDYYASLAMLEKIKLFLKRYFPSLVIILRRFW